MDEFRILGPIEIWTAGGAVELRASKHRSLLAALLVDAGRPVPIETLIDRVWDDAPPAGVRSALYGHLSRLRPILGRVSRSGGGQVTLLRRSGGYVITVDPDQVDLHRFRALVEQARGAGPTDEQRAALLQEANRLWRGEPLVGLPGGWAGRVRDELHQQRLELAIELARVQLRLGQPAAVVEALRPLVAAHPLVEPLAAYLMRALYADGRGAEALDVHTTIRRHLGDELGTEPGVEIRQVHQEILRSASEPPPADPPGRTGPPAHAVPAQLPLDVSGFVGRHAEIARLDAIHAAAGDQPTAVVVAVLTGAAGVGKTALAVHWAHRVRHRFPDGQLYINLRGFHPAGDAVEPAEAVREFLHALDVAPERIPAQLDAQTAMYRSVLTDRSMVIVLDNARDAEQVRPLLPGAAGCLVLITSRDRLTSLVAAEGAAPFAVDLLTSDGARALLAGRLGDDRLEAEPGAVEEIIDRCVRLPLALAIVAARAATEPRPSLTELARELRAEHGALDALTTGDAATDVRAAFTMSYRRLRPDAAGLFRILSLHPGPTLSAPAAASLLGAPPGRVRPLLAELTRVQLLTEPAPGRYAFHDLLRAYSTELIHLVESTADRRAAELRMLDHYLHSAHAADLLLDPQQDPVGMVEPLPGVTPETMGEAAQAMAWFAVEHHVLLASVGRAASAGHDRHAWQLAWVLTMALNSQGRWHDTRAVHRMALAAVRRSGNRHGEAYAHRGIALAQARLGDFGSATVHYRHALDLAAETGDRASQGRVHHNLGQVLGWQNRPAEAFVHFQRALEVYRGIEHAGGQARTLNAMGFCHAMLDNHQAALDCCHQALTLLRQVGDRQGEAATWDSLGFTYHRLGNYRQAELSYRNALKLMHDLGLKRLKAETFERLGDTHRAAGQFDAARNAWTRAREILEELGRPSAGLIAKVHHGGAGVDGGRRAVS